MTTAEAKCRNPEEEQPIKTCCRKCNRENVQLLSEICGNCGGTVYPTEPPCVRNEGAICFSHENGYAEVFEDCMVGEPDENPDQVFTTTVLIRLEVDETAKGDALHVINEMLDGGSLQDAIVEASNDLERPLTLEKSSSVSEEMPANGGIVDVVDATLALFAVRDLIWPPGFDRPDDSAIRGRSAILDAIMDRLAFLKPHA